MLIRHLDQSGCTRAEDLFATLAALSRNAVASFPALRPHQRQPWHAFCVQLAALALHRAQAQQPPEDAAEWRALLLALTPEYPDGEAWSLVVDDWAKPALLQPPLRKPADAADYKSSLWSPDALDMLVTSKNHDLKAARLADAADDDWLFALVTLQTYEGFMGAGNFGISRMNGGFSSRVALSVRPPGRPGVAFRYEVTRLLAARRRMLENYRALSDTGLALLWLEPWDGTRSRAFSGLDPYYLEICRRIRLRRENARLNARSAGSKAPRLAAKEITGVTGDPWAPIAIDDKAIKSWGPTAAGFGYRQITRLLDARRTRLPILADLPRGDATTGLEIVATAIVRGQGKTEGYHERHIPMSAFAQGAFNTLGGRALDTMAAVAQDHTADAGEIGRMLRRALTILHIGAPDRAANKDDYRTTEPKNTPWMRLYDTRVDADFFDEAFWAEVAEAAAEAPSTRPHRQAWRRRLKAIGGAVLDMATEAAPRTQMRRLRAKVRARSAYDRASRGFLKELTDA